MPIACIKYLTADQYDIFSDCCSGGFRAKLTEKLIYY